jgi:L-malate glycosyltransferase
LANRLLLERRDRVVAVGHAVKQALIEKEGLPPARVEVVYNGVELSPYLERRGDRLAVRQEIGVEPDAFVIIQVARLNHLKDHGTALRALTRIVRQRDDVRLVLVGIGEAQEEVQQLVVDLGLQRYVRFLGRRLDAARLLQAADLFLLTSITEGIPLTLIEAMASGLPIVATDVGGVKEVVSEGETALLAPPRDDARLADHVLAMAADSARRRQFGERGRVRAQARFTEQQMHEGYGRLYDDLLQE